MSHKLINHSPDIKKLRDEGYEVEIIGNYLLVHSVPYLNAKMNIVKGTLVTNVSITNNRIAKPDNHVISFTGDFPCNIDGTIIKQLENQNEVKKLTETIIIKHTFSNRPTNGYQNFYEKIIQYVKIISAPAKHIDPDISAQTHKVIESLETESVFNYSDTNSSKAEIDAINQKLSNLKIGIIGLGGTGSYILDFVAKTLVGEIHLFDGDKFLQHNAFRAPGAPSLDELKESIYKVDYFKNIYSKMHKYIFSHNSYINESNLGLFNELDFVFVCIDRGEIKKSIFKKLESLNLTFIDTGIGINRVDDSLLGTIRTTTSTVEKREHIWENRISFADDRNDDYSSNIQIAELNALNAIFAIIKWKKLYGFFNDLEFEHHSTYDTNVNQMISDEIKA